MKVEQPAVRSHETLTAVMRTERPPYGHKIESEIGQMAQTLRKLYDIDIPTSKELATRFLIIQERARHLHLFVHFSEDIGAFVTLISSLDRASKKKVLELDELLVATYEPQNRVTRALATRGKAEDKDVRAAQKAMDAAKHRTAMFAKDEPDGSAFRAYLEFKLAQMMAPMEERLDTLKRQVLLAGDYQCELEMLLSRHTIALARLACDGADSKKLGESVRLADEEMGAARERYWRMLVSDWVTLANRLIGVAGDRTRAEATEEFKKEVIIGETECRAGLCIVAAIKILTDETFVQEEAARELQESMRDSFVSSFFGSIDN